MRAQAFCVRRYFDKFGKNLPVEEYLLVKSDEDLKACIAHLRSCKAIGLDLEFDRDRFAYGFTLCLIQLSDGKNTWLIDPILFNGLEPLYRFLEEPAPIKIMHAPSEDITLLQQKGCTLKSIFDTERTARLLDFEQFSLGNLLLYGLGVQIDKSQQKTDWVKRPLSEEQLAYAARDVVFLPDLYSYLSNAANKKAMEHIVQEENAAWDTFKPEPRREGWYVNKDDEKKYPPYYLHIFNVLMGLRDKQAQQLNKPGYMLVAKEILADLAFREEVSQQWMQQRNMHPSLRNTKSANEYKTLRNKAASEAEALGLSRKSNVARRSDAEKRMLYEQRRKASDYVESHLRPIQEELIHRFGQYSGSYMLNERTMADLASGKLFLDQLPFAYRINLIREIAAELNIDLKTILVKQHE
jgi:ribonuclease D